MNSPKLYVLVGVPASGKSTWISNQDWIDNCVIVSTDVYVEKFARRLKSSYSGVFELVMNRAIRLMMRKVNKAKSENKDIVWDQTSTTVASRKRKFRVLPNYYPIAVVFKTPDMLELTRRLNNRPGKVIPQKVMKDMIDNFVMPSLEEGFKEIWFAE